MGSSYATIKNVSQEYRDYPPGCVPCPHGYKPGNPGTFEEIHKKFEQLEPRLFEGARILRKLTLSQHFHATHTLALCPKSPTLLLPGESEALEQGYQFGASYVGPKRVGPRERYPQLEGQLRPNGDLRANFVHTLGCRCRVKLSTRVKRGVYEKLRAALEYRTDDLTITTALVEPTVLKGEGVLVLQLLQAISPRLTLGAELACNRNADFPGGRQTSLAGAFRYSTGWRTLSATLGMAGLRICYHHKQSHELQMGVELQANFVTRESRARLVYEVNSSLADMTFNGFVDTDWRVGAVFRKKLYPIPEASLVLSGVVDYAKQNVGVGIGIDIGD